MATNTTTTAHRPEIERLALLGALLATFGELHSSLDQWAQNSQDSACKGLRGDHAVYRDGTPVGRETNDRAGQPTLTASRLGRRSVARHVASYTAGQLAGTIMATRALGYRVPARALLAGATINSLTHAVIDRRAPLLWLARKAGKAGYVDHCTAVRMGADGALTTEVSGPGTALLELDLLCTNSFVGESDDVHRTGRHPGDVRVLGQNDRQATNNGPRRR